MLFVFPLSETHTPSMLVLIKVLATEGEHTCLTGDFHSTVYTYRKGDGIIGTTCYLLTPFNLSSGVGSQQCERRYRWQEDTPFDI